MVVHYELSGLDLAAVRFAISPINELVLSLRSWRNPGGYPVHLPWIREVQQSRQLLDAEMLLALVHPRGWTPDFLTPRPESPLARIEDQLELVGQRKAKDVAAELADLYEGSPPECLRGPGARTRRRALEALRGYWDLGFAPHWSRIRNLLEADVVYRGRTMARHGIGTMLSELDHNVSYASDVASVKRASGTGFTRSVGGSGLTLVPTLFSLRASTPINPEEAPMIQYTVRGLGTLWEEERRPAPDALVALIGRTRTDLLLRLSEPMSSTELAVRLAVSVPAVNQHLRALREAGLLTSTRYGRSVLYRRSNLGDALLGVG